MSNFLKTCAVHWVLIVILVAGFCAGLGLILYTTAIAPWVYSDSTAYLISARNMADGLGLVLQTPAGTYEPLIWYPPLFSTIISILITFGAEMVKVARWINAGLFGAFISLGAYITWYFSRSKILTMSFIILVLLSPGLLQVYSGAISEPIFIFNTLAALFLCVVASSKIKGNFFWFMAGFFAGLAFLSRYIGIAVVITVCINSVLLNKNPIKQRLVALLWASVPAVSAIGIWTGYVYMLNGTLGGRSLTLPVGFETQIQEYILNLWTVIQSWIPYINRANHVIPALVKFIFIVMVLIGGYIFSRRVGIKNEFVEERNPAKWITVLFIFFVLYIGFHLAAYITSSAQPDAESRLFSPLYVAVLFLVTGIASALQNTYKFSKIWKAGFVAGVLIFVLYFHVQSKEYVQDMHANGRGYTSLQWKQSNLIREVKKIDSEEALVSNDAALVLFYTGRFPAQVAITDVVSDGFQPSDSTFIILFYPQEENVYGEKAYELFENAAEEYAVVFRDSDGGIYSEIIVK